MIYQKYMVQYFTIHHTLGSAYFQTVTTIHTIIGKSIAFHYSQTLDTQFFTTQSRYSRIWEISKPVNLLTQEWF